VRGGRKSRRGGGKRGNRNRAWHEVDFWPSRGVKRSAGAKRQRPVSLPIVLVRQRDALDGGVGSFLGVYRQESRRMVRRRQMEEAIESAVKRVKID
jgi:hypothetical protein